MEKIPYIVIDRREKSETNIDCYSVCKDELQETLLKVLQECMEYHEFKFVDEEKLFEIESVSEESLECDECGCRVILAKYITIVNNVKYCGACKPSSVKIDKGVYDRFQKFLDRKNAVSEIWYFDNGDWIKFMA
jgi:hypothetical protein